MEKLNRRSDGVYETPTGLLGISPRAVSGSRNGTSWFEFKAGHMSPVTRVEWPTGAPVIAIEADAARIMMLNNYAFNIDDEKMVAYNTAVDEYMASLGGEEKLPELKQDGPTVEQWVASGYQADAYPPTGYASKSTPEEIAAAIAAQKAPPAAAAPAAPVAPAVPDAPAAPVVAADETAGPKKGK